MINGLEKLSQIISFFFSVVTQIRDSSRAGLQAYGKVLLQCQSISHAPKYCKPEMNIWVPHNPLMENKQKEKSKKTFKEPLEVRKSK